MDILNRLGINNAKVNKVSRFAEFYSLKKDIKSNAVAIENSLISNSINDLISYRMSPSGEDGNERKGLLRKTKEGAVNIINKIIAFFKRVKDYIMKKFRQFKEFVFGKKAEKVQKATDAATTVIKEVLKRDGIIPSDVPNDAWGYIKKEMFGANESEKNKVDSIDIPRGLLISGSDSFDMGDIDDELITVGKYLSMLRYDEVIKSLKSGPLGNAVGNLDADEFGISQLKELVQKIGQAYARVITKFNGYGTSFSKHMTIESVPISEKEKLNKVLENLEEIKDGIINIKNMFDNINNKLIKHYDDTMKKIEKLKRELNGDANFNDLYREITEINSILITNNDKLLKEADQLMTSYDKLLKAINFKLK